MPVASPSRFQRYLTVFSRWMLILGLVFVLTKLAGDFVTNHYLPQYYRATVMLDVAPRPETKDAGNAFDRIGYEPEAEILQSSALLMPIIQDQNLGDVWARRVFKKDVGLSDEEALAYLRNSLSIEAVRGTDNFRITITDTDAKEAADIANAIADRYKKMREVEAGQASASSGDLLLEQSPVRIISRAEVPTKPNHRIAPMLTLIGACILALLAASFVEMILLFIRADDRHTS